MASPPKPKPAPSRWGFLSQAVASVESKLDTILADDDEPVKRAQTPVGSNKENVPSARGTITHIHTPSHTDT